MGSRLFYKCGFQKRDLIPVKNKMIAANREPITILGAICLRISGSTAANRHVGTAALIYISPDTDKFYLSCETMRDLKIIDDKFPNIPEAGKQENVYSHSRTAINISENILPHTELAECGCPKRTKPPPSPSELPYRCTVENIPLMRQWILDRYRTSTFKNVPTSSYP